MSTLRFWRKFDSLRARTFLRMLRVTVLISYYGVKMVVNLSVPYDCFELQAPGHKPHNLVKICISLAIVTEYY